MIETITLANKTVFSEGLVLVSPLFKCTNIFEKNSKASVSEEGVPKEEDEWEAGEISGPIYID